MTGPTKGLGGGWWYGYGGRAENAYNERVSRVENQIIARLRDRLGTARNANEMFRVFSKFNALFVRPKIRGAIQEYQTQLIDSVKEDIKHLHDKFKTQYRFSEAYHMSQMRDLPPIAGAIIWARQIEHQLLTNCKQNQKRKSVFEMGRRRFGRIWDQQALAHCSPHLISQSPTNVLREDEVQELTTSPGPGSELGPELTTSSIFDGSSYIGRTSPGAPTLPTLTPIPSTVYAPSAIHPSSGTFDENEMLGAAAAAVVPSAQVEGLPSSILWHFPPFFACASSASASVGLNVTDILSFIPSDHPIIPHLPTARNQLLENLSMFSEGLREPLLSLPADTSAEDILPVLRRSMLENHILPALCGSAIKNVRTDLVTDGVGDPVLLIVLPTENGIPHFAR
ncbi:hypothetical protein K435DRAFT_878859 [Dendrothele bispora CBS 962.96]|uniref:Dynein heavy chain tail domain-containing protein n=1 Tax=Dendrothele bispora (strain CBS 962.96) TaxID=1314807 RepID=A0A4S8KM81_DENBC|nr:hypothetical protein K435DRAFT_878859 [Dendrothele bispora CBS 962.96]